MKPSTSQNIIMKKILSGLLLFIITNNSQAQESYDSITISRCSIENEWHGKSWNDTLKAGRFSAYLSKEKTIWRKPAHHPNTLPPSLTYRIKTNGTEDISKCFIPRHSINYYKGGKIVRYLLVCFECDGFHFSDDPGKTFIKSIKTREKQLAEVKILFKEIL
jgi:hypothetical protein